MQNSVIISVNTVPERDQMIKDLYRELTSNKDKNYLIQQDRINRIKIFHIKGSLRILINTYVVIVLPVLLDLSSLENLHGTVDFRMDATIDTLLKLTHKLQTIQGKRIIKNKIGADGLKKALGSIF